MSLPSLTLWLVLFPMALVFGLAGALVTYFLARPRQEDAPGMLGTRRELLVEAWRLAAILATVPATILVAELSLWGLFFQERVSLAFTGLAQWLGLVLLALSPVPLLVAAIRQEPFTGRHGRLSMALVLVAVCLFPLGWMGRAWAWRHVAEGARRDELALREVLVLKGYGFISEAEAGAVLGRSIATTAGLLDLVGSARGPGGPPLDADVRAYLAARLESALLAADPGVTTAPDLAAVPAMWWLTEDSARTLRGYALSVHEFRGPTRAGVAADPQTLVVDALERGSDSVAEAVLAAADQPLAAATLRPATLKALTSAMDRPPPIGPMVQAILLRDGSSDALRPLLTRFGRPEDPAWDLVRRDCPARTAGLQELVADPDERVAAGAAAVLAYVRQNCAVSRPQGR